MWVETEVRRLAVQRAGNVLLATKRSLRVGRHTSPLALSEAIDVYSEWVDAIEAQEDKKKTAKAKTLEKSKHTRASAQEKRDGTGVDLEEDLPEVPFLRKTAPAAVAAGGGSEEESDAAFTDGSSDGGSFDDPSGDASDSQ